MFTNLNQGERMSKFILLYKGPATDPQDMDEEKRNGIMQAWKVWMENMGEALVDVGAPMFNGESVVDGGSEGRAPLISGYSIIQAEDIDATKKLVFNHPFLSDKTGEFSVEIYELASAPM